MYNELSEKLCKWGVTKRSIPLIEYCFKLYINDKACFGNFNVKAENLEEAYDIAYTTLASKLSGILSDIDIPYYVEAIKEEGYPRYRVLSYNSEKDEKECFITSDHTEARVKYNELDGESDTISLFIQTIFNYEEQGDGKIKVILYPSNVRFTIGIESLSISSDIRKVEIIFSYLRTQYRSMDAKLFNEIQENIIDQYIQYMAYEGIKKTNTLDFHVRMQECDLLKLYDLFIYHRDRNLLMVNANSCDNDVCCNRYASKYANAIEEEININEFNDVLIGNCYERDPERFSKLYDGMFKHFLESFNFEANGIYRIHDFTCADGVLIGRKMEFVFDKLF